MKRVRAWALLLVAGTVLAACSFFSGASNETGDPSLDREREITEAIAEQIRRSGRLINDPLLLGYLDELGQSLVAHAGGPAFFYRFAIIDDPSLNAFTVGGGHVYVHSGVLEQVGDMSELAGVLAHEIAHVAKRHVAKQQEGQGLRTLLSLAAVAAVVATGGDPELLLAAEGVNVALQLRNSRGAEAEADYAGLEYMVDSHIEPRGMVRFFERIVASEPRDRNAVPAYLYTHPALEDRIRAARSQLARLDPPADLRRRDDRLRQLQDRLATLRAPLARGSGLLARPAFDREAADAILHEAERLAGAGERARAFERLEQVPASCQNDPRLPLLEAELAEQDRDLERATQALARAVELDPTVALTQFEYGRLLSLQGQEAPALFHLDLAAAGARSGTSLRSRAERAIRLVVFDPWQALEFETRRALQPGQEQVLRLELHPQVRRMGLPLRVEWIDPAGVRREGGSLRAASGTDLRIRHRLTAEAAPGRWKVVLRLGDSRRVERVFDVVPLGSVSGRARR